MEKIKITNPNKILYNKGEIKKIDVISYYIDVSNLMLPFIENRLLSVIRCHGDNEKECFYKKHPTNDKDMVKIKKVNGEEYFYINTQEELIYQIQMGTIEFHPWGSLVKTINKPNMMVFDLDPDEKLPLEKLRDAVLKVKSVLDELNITSFLKTSGGKGYHIVVPFKISSTWKDFYAISKKVAELVEAKWPKLFTTNIRKSERKGKIFIDYLRNNKGSTCVAPYSVRARDSATISMPISWKDINKIKPNEITIKNYKKYLNNSWEDYFNANQTLHNP